MVTNGALWYEERRERVDLNREIVVAIRPRITTGAASKEVDPPRSEPREKSRDYLADDLARFRKPLNHSLNIASPEVFNTIV